MKTCFLLHLIQLEVPQKFLGHHDVLVVREEGRVEGMQIVLNELKHHDLKVFTVIQKELQPYASTSASPLASETNWPYVPGNEDTRNQRLALWVAEQLQQQEKKIGPLLDSNPYLPLML